MIETVSLCIFIIKKRIAMRRIYDVLIKALKQKIYIVMNLLFCYNKNKGEQMFSEQAICGSWRHGKRKK